MTLYCYLYFFNTLNQWKARRKWTDKRCVAVFRVRQHPQCGDLKACKGNRWAENYYKYVYNVEKNNKLWKDKTRRGPQETSVCREERGNTILTDWMIVIRRFGRCFVISTAIAELAVGHLYLTWPTRPDAQKSIRLPSDPTHSYGSKWALYS